MGGAQTALLLLPLVVPCGVSSVLVAFGLCDDWWGRCFARIILSVARARRQFPVCYAAQTRSATNMLSAAVCLQLVWIWTSQPAIA